MGVAKDLILTGRKVSAEEALRLNIVSAVYPPDQLQTEALALAEIIAKNAPLALREAKRALQKNVDRLKYYKLEQESAKICFGSKDLKEGITALFEKRPPEFQGQ